MRRRAELPDLIQKPLGRQTQPAQNRSQSCRDRTPFVAANHSGPKEFSRDIFQKDTDEGRTPMTDTDEGQANLIRLK